MKGWISPEVVTILLPANIKTHSRHNQPRSPQYWNVRTPSSPRTKCGVLSQIDRGNARIPVIGIVWYEDTKYKGVLSIAFPISSFPFSPSPLCLFFSLFPSFTLLASLTTTSTQWLPLLDPLLALFCARPRLLLSVRRRALPASSPRRPSVPLPAVDMHLRLAASLPPAVASGLWPSLLPVVLVLTST